VTVRARKPGRMAGRLTGMVLVVFALGASACNLLGGPSKVRNGELFETGEVRYDAYFKEVHDLQVSSAGWVDDRKASRRPLVDTLKLTPEAADVSIVQAAHERINGVARDVGPTKLEIVGDEAHLTAVGASKVDDPTRELFKAIEATARAELLRGKSLRTLPPKVDELTKNGRALEPHVREEFAKHGGRVGTDVQDELAASYEVLGAVSRDSRNGAREAEDFVADLQRAVATDPGESNDKPPPPIPRTTHTPKPSGAGAPTMPTPRPETPKPAPPPKPPEVKAADKPAPPKAAAKPKPPAAADEFNP
jgi:hypothetical protein